jgi:hypothetical protein
MTRARRKEHEADQVGAGFQRDFKGFGGFQAAYFDRQRHGGAGSTALSPAPQSKND